MKKSVEVDYEMLEKAYMYLCLFDTMNDYIPKEKIQQCIDYLEKIVEYNNDSKDIDSVTNQKIILNMEMNKNIIEEVLLERKKTKKMSRKRKYARIGEKVSSYECCKCKWTGKDKCKLDIKDGYGTTHLVCPECGHDTFYGLI